MESPIKKHGTPNIQAVLAVGFVLFAFYIFRMVLLSEVKATESTTISIISAVTNIVMLIVGYYFGSSSGSKKKDEIIGKQNPTDNSQSGS